MNKILSLFCSAIILSLSVIYTEIKILDKPFNKKFFLKYLSALILLSLYLVISYMNFTNLFIRYLLFILMLTILIFFIYRENIQKIFAASFFTWFLSAISEFIFAIVVVYICKMNVESFYGVLIGNIVISIILSLLIQIPKLLDTLRNLLTKIVELKSYYYITLIFLLAVCISITVYINYFDTSSKSKLVLSLIIILFYTIITMILFNEKSNGLKMQYEYEAVLKNLNEYEKMLDYQKVANHENKNQLLVLKGMLVKHDKKLDEYIDSIISERKEDDEDFFYKTNLIPSGGLRGLVYYKLLAMKDKNIKVDLTIESKIRRVKLENLCISVNKDICKIVGVILDNAIQAVENLEQKNIDIEMKKEDNKFIITVSNNFDGLIDLGNIENSGYTTKGNGHGYGLTLMKQLVNKNTMIENKRYIYGNMFVQKIIIEI